MTSAIEVADLHKVYRTNSELVRALDGVSFQVPQGRTLRRSLIDSCSAGPQSRRLNHSLLRCQTGPISYSIAAL
jgi:hypothetical protein